MTPWDLWHKAAGASLAGKPRIHTDPVLSRQSARSRDGYVRCGAPAVTITQDPLSWGTGVGQPETPPSSVGRGLRSPTKAVLGQGCPQLCPPWGCGLGRLWR